MAPPLTPGLNCAARFADRLCAQPGGAARRQPATYFCRGDPAAEKERRRRSSLASAAARLPAICVISGRAEGTFAHIFSKSLKSRALRRTRKKSASRPGEISRICSAVVAGGIGDADTSYIPRPKLT